jgi:threonine/homoserine/homoserine lactone efflux protein
VFDARFYAYLGVAALLVLSPGATIAVITEVVVEDGRRAGLWTVLGVAVANSTLSLAAAFGMSALVRQSPWVLRAVTMAGACYLAYLGVRGVRRAVLGGGAADPGAGLTPGPAVTAPFAPSTCPVPPATPADADARATAVRSFGKGVATNLLNASVALFYMTVVPQFIGRGDPFLSRFLVLSAAHVTMAALWHLVYAWFIGTLSQRIARAGVRRGMELATGAVLCGLALRLII